MLETMRASLASRQISDDVAVSASIRSATVSEAYALLTSDAAAPNIPTVTTTATAVVKCKRLTMDGRYARVSGVAIFLLNRSLRTVQV